MNADNRKRLNEARRRYLRAQHPGVPEHALPSQAYSDKTANGLTRCILDWIKFNGGHAERVANMGRPVISKETKGDVVRGYHQAKTVKWIPGTGRNGSADVHALIGGRSVMIEVKIGRDKMSAAQVRYAADIVRAGGVYIVARTFDEFIKAIEI